jgi:hypothetical protein
MAGQTFGTCGYGTYSQVNIEGCPPLIRALTFLCGFPLPCCCGCWACGCGEGPCGFSCSKVRGKGLSQFLLKAELNDVNPVKKFGKRNGLDKPGTAGPAPPVPVTDMDTTPMTNMVMSREE